MVSVSSLGTGGIGYIAGHRWYRLVRLAPVTGDRGYCYRHSVDGGWNLVKKRPNFCILADVRQFGGGGWWWGVGLGIIEIREAAVDR